MKEVIWRVRIKTAPAVDKYCKGCRGKSAFLSSGLFRVNAQQKSLDVWLIYKCSVCETTWNMTVLSRINPHSVSPETLRGFHGNDSELAMRYASDFSLIKRNGGNPGLPDIEIQEADIDLSESARIRIITGQATEIRLLAVLRDKLGLSRSQLERLCDSGRLRCVSGQDIKRCKLAGEIIIEII